MSYYKKIDGDKIYLSPINIDDASIYVKWLSDPNISDKLHSTKRVFNELNEKEFLNKRLSNGDYIFSIIKKSDDKIIGTVSLNEIDYVDRTATIGIFIGESDNHNKGYGSDALRAILKYGFGVLNLYNIDLKVFDFNEQAINCYKKVGFKEYGRRHKAYYINNEYHDLISMEILKDEFYK